MNGNDTANGAAQISNEHDGNNRDYNAHREEAIIDGFLKSHRFTMQTRRELAEWLPEIAYRENISVNDIINSENIQSILKNEKLNNPQRHQKIRDELYKKRFPEYSTLQEQWKRTAAAANPAPSKITFTPSPAFEKKRLEIKLTISSAEEAKELIGAMSEIAPQTWDNLLYPRAINTASRTHKPC